MSVLEGTRAVVTGGTSGLSRAMAEAMAEGVHGERIVATEFDDRLSQR